MQLLWHQRIDPIDRERSRHRLVGAGRLGFDGATSADRAGVGIDGGDRAGCRSHRYDPNDFRRRLRLAAEIHAAGLRFPAIGVRTVWAVGGERSAGAGALADATHAYAPEYFSSGFGSHNRTTTGFEHGRAAGSHARPTSRDG